MDSALPLMMPDSLAAAYFENFGVASSLLLPHSLFHTLVGALAFAALPLQPAALFDFSAFWLT